jgi:hypothetical protein
MVVGEKQPDGKLVDKSPHTLAQIKSSLMSLDRLPFGFGPFTPFWNGVTFSTSYQRMHPPNLYSKSPRSALVLTHVCSWHLADVPAR